MQEYADPVIDWLEVERKYFTGRYYRQHCTLRNGAYIKDLAQVEPDLSKVMILDNSPLSYVFHPGENLLVRNDLCNSFADVRKQTTPFQSKAGLATQRTTSSCISSRCWKVCSMSPTYVHCWRCGWVCLRQFSQVATL